MAKELASYALGELTERFGLQLCCPDNFTADARAIQVTGFSALDAASPSHLAFLTNQSYRKFLPLTRAGAVILREADSAGCPVPALLTDNPYLVYARISALFAGVPAPLVGVHPTAVVSPDVSVPATACVGPHVVIGQGVQLGDDVVISAGCVVGDDVVIGKGSYLYPRVTLYHGVALGERVRVHSGAVIGADGFGFAKAPEGWCKIHQLGRVVIGHDVEIGANTCIDRGAIGDTVIADGVIIDNLVQVAHNVRIGKQTAIAACTGIAGSAVIGDHCTIAGAVGIVGHITIADHVHITAKTLVTGSIHESGSYSSGTALQITGQWRKNAVRFLQLDRLFDRVRALESRSNKS